ncbi:uncharacterized protein [Palaemon carinicauda]|uniref:uncharacterized protein n=1 Tax=Palaemon carinicauda TaxID=392227 RepID=UPI0035B67B11
MPKKKAWKRRLELRDIMKERHEQKRKLKLYEKEKMNIMVATPSCSGVTDEATSSATPDPLYESEDDLSDEDDIDYCVEDEGELDIQALNDTNSECVAEKSGAEIRKLLFAEYEKVHGLGEGSGGVEVNEECPVVLTSEQVIYEMAENMNCRDKKCNGSGELTINREYFDSDIKVTCNVCERVIYEKNSPRMNVTGHKRATVSPITTSIVYNTILDGTGYSGVRKLSGVLSVDLMSKTVYERNKEYVHSLGKNKYDALQKKVQWSVVEYYRKMNIHPDDNGVLDIDVIYDGTWMTRGHNSNIGAGIVVEACTGFVLDAEILSKFCYKCVVNENKLKRNEISQEEFEVVEATHKESKTCTRNFEKSSGMMEAEGAKKIWSRSISKYNFRYSVFVGDGDSSAYNAVIGLNNNEGPYGRNHRVKKEECINHFAKRLGSRLRNLRERLVNKVVTKTGKTRFHKYLRGKGKLSDTTIGHLVMCLSAAIRRAKSYDECDRLEKLRRDILATLLHVTSTDEAPDHSLCPDGERSWCFYKADISRGKEPRTHQQMKVKINLPPDVKHLLQEVYDSLTTDELLERCLKGRTQNINESFNGKLWAKCPKTKFQGLQRVIAAFQIVASEHNSGYEESSLVPQISGAPPGKAQAQQEKERLKQSLRGKIESKKVRKRLREPDQEEEQDDPGYKAGAF